MTPMQTDDPQDRVDTPQNRLRLGSFGVTALIVAALLLFAVWLGFLRDRGPGTEPGDGQSEPPAGTQGSSELPIRWAPPLPRVESTPTMESTPTDRPRYRV